MRAPLAYVGTRSRRPPSSAHTDWPRALPRMSQHAVSMAESASAKIPPGPELPAARRSLAAMASVCVGSSPTTRPASVSTATLSAAVSAPPKNVRPTPTNPWSVPSSRVTNSRVSVGAGRPTTSGLSAGVRSTRVVTWVIFMAASLGAQGSRGGILPRRAARGGGRAPPPSGVEGPASLRGNAGRVSRGSMAAVLPVLVAAATMLGVSRWAPGRLSRHVVLNRHVLHRHVLHIGLVVHRGRGLVHDDWLPRDDDRRGRRHENLSLDDGGSRDDGPLRVSEDAGARDDLVEHGERAEAESGVGSGVLRFVWPFRRRLSGAYLRQEVSDDDGCVRRDKRRNERLGTHYLPRRVPPAARP